MHGDVKMQKGGDGSGFHPDSMLYRGVYFLIRHIFPPVFRLVYGWRVVGKVPDEDMKNGCVSVCNHVHMLDCIMLGCAFKEYRMQFITLASNLRIPLAGPIVKLMGGIALPADLSGWRGVFARVEKAFLDGQVVQVYPEGELRSGCRSLREFLPGAFTFAVKYKKPVIPCVLRFYPRYRWNGKRKRDGMELAVLSPVYPPEGMKGRAAAQQLKEIVWQRMERALKEV